MFKQAFNVEIKSRTRSHEEIARDVENGDLYGRNLDMLLIGVCRQTLAQEHDRHISLQRTS